MTTQPDDDDDAVAGFEQHPLPWLVKWIGTAYAFFDANGAYVGGLLDKRAAHAAAWAVNVAGQALSAGDHQTSIADQREAVAKLWEWWAIEAQLAAQGVPINVVRWDRPLTDAQRKLLDERDRVWREFVAARDACARP